MKAIFLIIMTLFINVSIAQEIEAKLISKILIQVDKFIGVDDLNNMYYIKNGILFKQTKQITLSYSNLKLGQLSSVNIQNPFKLILFYKNFNSVIILDNNLNELSDKIDFTLETKFNNVLFVGSSSENNIWLYADDNKLHLYDYQKLSDEIQTQPITFYHNNFIPKSLISSYKNVWVLSDTRIVQFNEYGNFIQSFNIDGVDNLFPYRKGFIYVKNDSFVYQTKDNSSSISLEIDHPTEDIYINSSTINIYDGKNLYQYKFL